MLLLTFETIDLIVTDMIIDILNFLKASVTKIDLSTVQKQPWILDNIEMIIIMIQNNFSRIMGLIVKITNFLYFILIRFRINHKIKISFFQIIFVNFFSCYIF